MDFVPYFEEIDIDYEPGATQEVKLHDGSRIYLRKLGEYYDPLDKVQAFRVLEETRRRGEFATGLIYVEPRKIDFLSALNMVDEPLATLPEARVRPGRAALEEVMEALR